MNIKSITLRRKLGQENKLFDVGIGGDFFNLMTKAQINKWNYIILKNFCTAKKTINRMKMQPTEWEKIFANHISDKGLI